MKPLKQYLQETAVSGLISYLERNPEKNLANIMAFGRRLAINPNHKKLAESVERYVLDKNSNWHHFTMGIFRDIHPNVIKRMGINFFVNATLYGVPKQQEAEKELGVGVPWAILMDPTEACNLRCKGCWAGDYTRAHQLSFDLMDRICTEAKELGIYFIVLSGGEPTVRKDDIFKLAEKHNDMVFHLFTNGTLIDEDFADKMVKLGNVTVAVSIDGLEESTDYRRGKGVFQKVMRAMDIMREKGAVFGFSTTYTRLNTEEVASDEFIDLMIEKGARFGWYFTYIPVGAESDLEFMATPEQRKYMYERVNQIRATKPLFVVDFWNDGEASNGCIAGGRRYFHINAMGDIEPCAFIHYANDNIKDMSLKEALKTPIFRSYQKRQPFNTNLLRPCPLIDNPEMLRDIVIESGAHNTQEHDDTDIRILADKLKDYSEAWGEVSGEIWSEKEKIKNDMAG
ncbi:radical SAM protein [Caldanaerobius polysaccharolyticus]|uniref:radical SAM protein n=1 Tax=Caldanaerobius polysaccharolyticus TaxID=44256 RepID=UPI000B3002DB|nr:radical SAM protein [Caldanaerobius polysaccharolyticus]